MAPLSLSFRILGAVFHREAKPQVPRGVFPCPLPRRLSALSQASLSCVARLSQELGTDILTLPVIYASRHGELERTHALFQEWAEFGEMSPAGFSLSVHNATASLLGLACHNQNSSTTLAAGPETLQMGLLEALMISRDSGPCLFVYGDCHPSLQAAALVLEHGSGATRNLPDNMEALEALWISESHP